MKMAPQYRAELRDLRKAKKKIASDYRKLAREYEREKLKMDRSLKKADRACAKQVERINRRMAILEGRLS